MQAHDARAAGKRIGELWPNVSAEQVREIVRQLQDDFYAQDTVERIVGEMFSTVAMFSLAGLRSRIEARRAVRNERYERDREHIHRMEEWHARASRHIDSLSDDEWCDALQAALPGVLEPWRTRWASDPEAARRATSVRATVYEVLTSDRAPEAGR